MTPPERSAPWYRPRAAASKLAAIASALPVAVVTGARQTGKSSLIRFEPSTTGYARYDLDNIETRSAARDDPHSFVRRAPKLIIDEVQRVPDLLLAIKSEVDREQQRTRGRFILSGSANLLIMRQVADSLAGRAGYLVLEPLTRAEQRGSARTGNWQVFFDHPVADWPALIEGDASNAADWRVQAVAGGYPVPALELDAAARAEWFSAYLATYLERDLRELSAIEDLGDFRRAMRSFALRSGTPINIAEVARDLGLVARTLRRWVELLDVTYQMVRLPAFAIRESARLRKRAKYYWNDSALAMHVAGSHAPLGVHFETLVFSDLRAWAAIDQRRPTLHYWRDESDREVDFVIERDGKVLGIEVKATTNPGVDDWKHLRHFVGEYRRRCIGGVLLHGGDQTFVAAEGVLAAPWWSVM
jgi:predicted AAA+ superfamily ATPase